MKPTPSQRAVLEAIASGEWELGGPSQGSTGRIQKGGLGRSGETRTVRVDLHYTLYRRGWIRQNPDRSPYDVQRPYSITEAGRLALTPGGDPEAKADPPKPKLQVWGYRGHRLEAAGPHKQTRELVAAPSRAAAIRALNASTRFRIQPDEVVDTANAQDVAAAMAEPGTVFWRALDPLKGDGYHRAPAKE